MRNILRSALFALLVISAPALPLGAAHASPAGGSATAAVQTGSGSSGGAWAMTASSPTPSPGDTASTGPANPGTGESAQNESTRLDFAPWVIGGIALATLIVVLIWRRRRNTTIV
ncbi:LuxR family transcriptional regulator [Pseudarthrobacter sp. NamE5]|uniref:LuxR family transcriptional regulator n=1 Tax=Pseudarthrobacter sp. NamE5 TaxID=2576839 RepID=UPI00110B71AD|nr:LuxR family transcriptional regulator [Pseudarthrobacter sp. NamE5]TLM88127.1 LuxR family transcriptional regulator [Pseudarthrobacter sp. NamE5]